MKFNPLDGSATMQIKIGNELIEKQFSRDEIQEFGRSKNLTEVQEKIIDILFAENEIINIDLFIEQFHSEWIEFEKAIKARQWLEPMLIVGQMLVDDKKKREGRL